MRILYLHRTQGEEPESIHIAAIVEALRSLGHEVSLIGPTPLKRAHDGQRGLTLAGRIKRLAPRWAFELLQIAYNAIAWRQARRALRDFRPDVIYERYALFAFAGVVLARARRIPLILEVNTPYAQAWAQYYGLNLRRLACWLERRTMMAADHVITVTEVQRQMLIGEGLPAARVSVTHNAIDPCWFDAGRHDSSLRRQLGLRNIVVGFVGTMNRWQGIPEFSQVLESVLTRRDDVSFLFVGDGELRAGLESFCRERGFADRVRFTGRKPHQDVPPLVAAMDIAVLLNSNRYGSPMKIFEYLGMAKAVVAPTVPPVLEVVRDGVTGLLIEPGNATQMTDRILRLAADPDLRSSLGRAGRQYVVAHHTWRQNALHILQQYEQLTARRPARSQARPAAQRRPVELWLPAYLASAPARLQGAWARRDRLTHIVFLVCDHFEPRNKIEHADQPQARMQTWRGEFARLQQRCRDAYGHAPLHSFFYPPHHGDEHLGTLAEWVFDGLGEVELHYHHQNDTSAKLRADLRATLTRYNSRGLLLESGLQPRASFGFIHGDWALDNSRHGRFCGVNGELTILQELGCWCDFTMPSTDEAQTRKINSIYYAVGDPSRPKSHDSGRDARVGVTDRPGLLLMQGPLGINWRAPRHPQIENASLTTETWGRPDRIRKWLDCQVHVKGRPEWLFVKLHCHGAVERDFDAVFGERAFEMHRVLNEHYNDGRRWRLHYVTARQAFNIVRAAEHGLGGDPSAWVDFKVPPQACSLYFSSTAHRLRHCTPDRLTLDQIEPCRDMHVSSRIGPAGRIEAPLTALDVDARTGRLALELEAPGEVILETAADVVPRDLRGLRPIERRSAGARLLQRFEAVQRAEITLTKADCTVSTQHEMESIGD